MPHTPARHPQNPEKHPDAVTETLSGDAVALGQGFGRDVAGVDYPPCSPEFDPTEHRAYAGVFASKLAGMADKLVKHRLAWGFGPCSRAYHTLTDKIKHALYI